MIPKQYSGNNVGNNGGSDLNAMGSQYSRPKDTPDQNAGGNATVQFSNGGEGISPKKNSQYKDLTLLGLQKKKGHIYKIEEAVLPTNFNKIYEPLPGQVEFTRIISNIMNARKIKKQEEWGKDSGAMIQQSDLQTSTLPSHSPNGPFITGTQSFDMRNNTNNSNIHRQNGGGAQQLQKKRETEYEKWQRYLSLEENVAVVSDSFWFAISKFQEKRQSRILPSDEFKVEERKFKNIQEKLLNRIAKNYVNVLLSIENKNDNNAFFKMYFDIIAQAVFYSFFYAFPKSRSEFANDLKSDLINEFSHLFTGIQITNSYEYWSKWNLDLGAGNILAVGDDKKGGKSSQHGSHGNGSQGSGSSGGQNSSSTGNGSSSASASGNKSIKNDVIALPSLTKETQNPRNKRVLMPIKFSPIIDKYIHSHNYQTKNYVTGFKMKFTQYDVNKDAIEQKFKTYLDIADKIREKSDEMVAQNNASTKKMKEEIKKLKNETIKHHRRLEKRKQEELERGAHEYANYLVSMLDAGLARGNIGVINQNPLS